MKNKTYVKLAMICLSLSVLVMTLLGCGTGGQISDPTPTGEVNGQSKPIAQVLTISAAASLADAMEEIKQLFEEKSVHTLVMNYGSSGSLQQQIEQGAPADVFISAAQHQMDVLEESDLLIPGSRIDFLQNTLVLIVPITQKSDEVIDFLSLSNNNVKTIAIGVPESVPAGRYAKEILSNLGIWDSLGKKIVLAKDVRQIVTYVETGNVDAGIVYLTDAMRSNQVEVIASAPSGSHTPATYSAAIVLNTKFPEAATEFMTVLQSTEGREIFEKNGFAYIFGK